MWEKKVSRFAKATSSKQIYSLRTAENLKLLMWRRKFLGLQKPPRQNWTVFCIFLLGDIIRCFCDVIHLTKGLNKSKKQQTNWLNLTPPIYHVSEKNDVILSKIGPDVIFSSLKNLCKKQLSSKISCYLDLRLRSSDVFASTHTK